jgi:concanavalin A-like lectin/glucanase superfamily protein
VADPYWANVVLLAVNDSKADATTAFDDQSDSDHALTPNGAAQYDTAQAPSGLSSSMLLDGTGDYLSTPDHGDWNLAAGDFTVECFIKYNSVAGSWLISQASNADGSGAWALIGQISAAVAGFFTTDGTFGTGVFVDNTGWTPGSAWHHVELTRSGSSWRLFIDGVQHGTTLTAGNTIFNGTSQLCIGADNGGSQSVNGWMAAIRITKGVARHTTNFTPPTLPLETGGGGPVMSVAAWITDG